MDSNIKQEAMDIAYVRYEPIQDPYSNSVHTSRGNQYRPQTSYTTGDTGTHYVETVHYNDYEGRSVVYEEVPNSPQQGHWRSGTWKPNSKHYDSDYYEESSYYSPVTKSFTTKSSYPKSNASISVESSMNYGTNNASYGTSNTSYGTSNTSYGTNNTNYGTSNTRSKSYNTSTVASYGYEERGGTKVTSKPLQVKIVNPRPDSSKIRNVQQQQKVQVLPQRAQTVSRNPFPQQITANVGNTYPGEKRKASVLQYSYQNSFVGSGASRRFQDSNEGIEENGGATKTNKWRGPATIDGGIKKRKKTPAEKHLRLRKYVQPKNALMCLNELMQGMQLKFEQEGSSTLGAPICMTVEVNGQKYKGFGSSKLSAKQAAAEAALVSFVKPPPPAEEEDKTPWGVLASFAMFKLFNEWKEGRIGMNSSSTPAASFGAPVVPDPTSTQTLQSMLSKSLVDMDMKAVAGQKQDSQSSLMASFLGGDKKDSRGKGIFDALSSQLKKANADLKAAKRSAEEDDDSLGDSETDEEAKASSTSPKKTKKRKKSTVNDMDDGAKNLPAPAKVVPDKAATIHPVMLLHQMRPTLTYEQFACMKGDRQEFTLKCTIDGQVFQGTGGTVKKAKYDLAVKANSQLFNVITTYTPAPN